MTSKLIKSITTNKFEIMLCELPNGQYVVCYETTLSEGLIFGEPVSDYNNASFMYDIKLKELEGH